MGYEIQAEELYNLVQVDSGFDQDELESLMNELRDGLLDTPYVVVMPLEVHTFGEEWIRNWTDFNAEILEAGGLLIFVHFTKNDLADLDDAEMMSIPTLEEAVDYIFMDRLEKEMD